MTDKHLTEDEAKRFLELLEALEADMEDAFSDAANETFRDESDTAVEDFEEKWGMPPSTAYTARTRGKYRRFINNAYLNDE